MSVEVGAKVTGKISGITKFGAFVDLGNKKTGLVHISEVSDGFVKDIHDVLSVGDETTVKVISIGEDGKIALSIRKAMDKSEKNTQKNDHYHHQNDGQGNGHKEYHEKKSNYTGANHNNSKSHSFNNPKRSNNENKKKDFDSLMAGFLKESEDRLTSLKRNTEGKRGGRGGRRN
ncbi:RNA-binding protein S1 [Ligilactobacillus sp. WILCCON 0076]|uniref:RNA-binding protein S1 n=1 Tax=Ligilactobacillus ubinensis TaxID=2876789 RepID=A0A9X2FJI1_9LACO|nr:S1 domain-containing RNA-binding protein [Ligilactobacillus ubinensis]MCP0886826.1 RNA-binding protein S1 [Ligilactobacillus ubinensis]